MSFMMQVVQLRLFRSFAHPFDPGMKRNLCYGVLARRNLFHHPKSGSWLNGGSFLRGILQPGVGFTSERGGAAAEVGVLQEVL